MISATFFSVVLLFTSVNSDDSAAMQKLAAALTPAPSGWSGQDYCSWKGVSCTSSNVVGINLQNQKLSGTLPPELTALSSLQKLSLQGNFLSGPVPSLANLSSLQEVHLDNNSFTSFPDGFFHGLTGLTRFSITENTQLAPWGFPSDLIQAGRLTEFMANQANIVGTIPDIFGSLPSLSNLRLSYNNLTGPLPLSFNNSRIQNLWLNNQKVGLSGTIDVLSGMTGVVQIWLHNNSFSGIIPDLSKCVSLSDLELRDNQLTGLIPASLINLPSLRNISLSNNKFQGPMPKFQENVTVYDTGNNFCLNIPGTPCDAQVTTLLEVAGGFGYPLELARYWQGNDACIFAFVSCNAQKEVIFVDLGKQNLGGIISPAFGKLTSLSTLNLNDNNLTGSIPDSLPKLTKLQTVNVSNNNLSGKVPTFSNSVNFISKGNPLLVTEIGLEPGFNPSGPGGGSPGSESGVRVSAGVIVGVVIAIIIFVAFVSYVVQRQSSGNSSDSHFLEGGNVLISIEVLRQVTDNFSEDNIIGKGGFGVVYKGVLHDGTKIAVKRMEASQMDMKGIIEFQAEIDVLTKVRHKHLVALQGYCINGIERLLVYEYMSQGTLTQHLFEWREHRFPPLNWKQRVTIALDIARGVEYLHSLAQQSFIHRDLKPSNILLGDDMRAKVADFGLVKLSPDGKCSMETRLAGTFGYLAPEYAATGRVTTKVDVYAFGVILMEIVTGRKALDDSEPDERGHLVAWFHRVIFNKDTIVNSIDQTLDSDEETLASISKIADLAGHCTAREPYQRPDMGHAVNILVPLVEKWSPTSQDDKDDSGIDLRMSLRECLQRWQANEGTSTMVNVMSNSQTHSSIPERMVRGHKS